MSYHLCLYIKKTNIKKKRTRKNTKYKMAKTKFNREKNKLNIKMTKKKMWCAITVSDEEQ